jgi:hypothetical protein
MSDTKKLFQIRNIPVRPRCLIMTDAEIEQKGKSISWRGSTMNTNTIFSNKYTANTLFNYTGRPSRIKAEDPPYASVTPPATD